MSCKELAMAENQSQDWSDIEDSYWATTLKDRQEEDRQMLAKYEEKQAPIRKQLTELLDERQRLAQLLQEVKRQCDVVEAQIDATDLQFEEAKQYMSRRRETQDENARAWFTHNKVSSADRGGQAQQNGDHKSRQKQDSLTIRERPNGHALTPRSDITTADEPIRNGHVKPPNGSVSADSTPLSQPPEEMLTGAEVWDADGNLIGQVKHIHLENRYVRQILQIPVQRRAVVRPGRKFTEETMEAIYEPSDNKGAKWLSCMIQATGEEQDTPCTACLSRSGTWAGCVIVGGEDFPRCANCEWNRQGCTGSSYHQERSRDPDLQSNPYQRSPESPFGEYPAPFSREGTSSGGFTPVNSGYRPAPEPSTALAPKRTSLPSKKGSRKSLPNLTKTEKENVEPNDESILGGGEDSEGHSVDIDPGPDITKATLVLRDNGVVYTEPEIMRGVPLERITPEHSYWDPNWDKLDEVVQGKLDSWKRKLEDCLAQNKNRFLAGRQVNRGNTIMTFLSKADFHPYQLVGKNWITKGLITYDTIFRLAQVIEELPKLSIDVTPVEWVRQRMHEIYTEQGDQFQLSKTVHDLYHDPKLKVLRKRAGFGNIGRPSGVKKGTAAKSGQTRIRDRNDNTPSRKRRRQSTSSNKELKVEEPEDSGLTLTPRSQVKRQRTDHDGRPTSSRTNGTDVKGESPTIGHLPDPEEGDFAYSGYTSTDSYSHDNIMFIDWRIIQIKTHMHTTNPSHTQYWHWVSDKKGESHFEHQVLRTVSPQPSWGVYKEPLDFHLRQKEVDNVEFTMEGGCTKIVVHTKQIPDVEYRGKLLVHLKRERTLKRFLSFLRKRGFVLVEKSQAYIEAEWDSIQSTVLPHSDSDE